MAATTETKKTAKTMLISQYYDAKVHEDDQRRWMEESEAGLAAFTLVKNALDHYNYRDYPNERNAYNYAYKDTVRQIERYQRNIEEYKHAIKISQEAREALQAILAEGFAVGDQEFEKELEKIKAERQSKRGDSGCSCGR